jgi:hypothetical protein
MEKIYGCICVLSISIYTPWVLFFAIHIYLCISLFLDDKIEDMLSTGFLEL